MERKRMQTNEVNFCVVTFEGHGRQLVFVPVTENKMGIVLDLMDEIGFGDVGMNDVVPVERFDHTMDCLTSLHSGEMMWTSDGRCGIHFVEPLQAHITNA